MRPTRPIPVAAVLTAVTLTLAGCAVAASAGGAHLPANAPALEQAYVSVVARVLPSVVQITTDHDLGSGVVFDGKGDIVTNAHVVGSATKFQVRLAGSASPYPASLVGSYPPDDLAVVHLDSPPSGLRPAHFGDSSKLAIGDIVLAMGNPLGLTGTVTNGIVSGPGRTVTEPQGGGSPGATLPDAIQTSAAINPGNSGGALVDLAGDVIGIPTLAAIDTQIGGTGGSAAPGIGFAIASNLVTDVAGQLVATGHVTNSHRAELGVQVATVLDPNGEPTGVGIENVIPGGPAAAAGLQPGEIITAVNNTPVHSTPELAAALAHLNPGQTVPITITNQQGQTRTVMVTLGQLPGS
ncbi:MAG: signal protein PDZ [Pseudonocardiales bacterium]|nr:MAG: signal protein PDZ [Pseudonocardiales bacterium]